MMARSPRKKPSRSHVGAALALYAPSDERRQHDRITLAPETIRDDNGDIAQPYRVHSMLDRLVARGAITDRMRDAGEEFNRLHRLAASHPLRAADLMQEVRYRGGDRGQQSERARQKLNAALDALGGHGSPAADCVWFVLGDEMTLRDWAIRLGWSNRPVSEHVAKGTLIAALGVLEGFFYGKAKSG